MNIFISQFALLGPLSLTFDIENFVLLKASDF